MELRCFLDFFPPKLLARFLVGGGNNGFSSDTVDKVDCVDCDDCDNSSYSGGNPELAIIRC